MTDRDILEKILGKVDALENRMGALEQGQQETNKGLDALEHGQGALSVTVQTFDKKIESIVDDIRDVVLHGHNDHEARITALEEHVGIKPNKN